MTTAHQKSTNVTEKSMTGDNLSMSTTTDTPAAQSAVQAEVYDLSAVVETLLASPEFKNSARFDDFLVPPSLSPSDEFTMSPSLDDSPLTATLDTPTMNDLADDFGIYGSEYSGMPLFGDGSISMYQLLEQEAAQEALAGVYELPKSAPTADPTAILPLLPSPLLPSFDVVSPTALDETLSSSSAVLPPAPTPPAAASPVTNTGKPATTRGRKSIPTGTRKNITPESLVPVEAPIQSRKYATPSATSRKELPAAFLKSQKRKRSRAQAFGDEEDSASPPDDTEDHPPPNASEKEIIEWKRRQNTLAARKSRKRKLEHQQFLETRVKDLESENEKLKVRNEALEAALRAHNIFTEV